MDNESSTLHLMFRSDLNAQSYILFYSLIYFFARYYIFTLLFWFGHAYNCLLFVDLLELDDGYECEQSSSNANSSKVDGFLKYIKTFRMYYNDCNSYR